jgi:CPA2 family monovalent cation:H+ antiporter-2
MLLAHWLPIVVITLAVVVGKVFACSFGAFAGGNDRQISLRVGMSLAQIGEFSFIIAALGLALKVTSDFLYPIAVAVSAITTFLTPYLIRSSDTAISHFDRVAPRSLVVQLDLYTQRAEQFGKPRHTSMARSLIRRWTWQMILNAFLITALFLGAAFLAQQPPGWFNGTALQGIGFEAMLWFAAVLLSLPLFIATFRKLQALGLLLAELKVPQSAEGARAAAVRSVVAQSVPVLGTVVLGVYVLLLSSALLPPFNILVLLLGIVALIAWLLRRSFIRVYSMAQAALRETLTQPPPSRPSEIGASIAPVLREADLKTVCLDAASPALGKLIRELQLRTRTGASIVAIERGGVTMVNPAADEELQAGDRVLLLGTQTQLRQACCMLSAGDQEPGRGDEGPGRLR